MPHYTSVFTMTKEQKVMDSRCCYRHTLGDVTLTMTGGIIEEEESHLVCVQREFLEETGYCQRM